MDKRLVQAFGKTLKEMRNAREISQEELAFRADLDRTFISMLERGVRQPTLTTLFQLAQVLGVSATELLKDAERAAGKAKSAEGPLLRAAEAKASPAKRK